MLLTTTVISYADDSVFCQGTAIKDVYECDASVNVTTSIVGYGDGYVDVKISAKPYNLRGDPNIPSYTLDHKLCTGEGVNHEHLVQDGSDKESLVIRVYSESKCTFRYTVDFIFGSGVGNVVFPSPQRFVDFSIQFDNSIFDNTPPELDVVFDNTVWKTPQLGVTITTTATDEFGVKSVEYKIVS